MAKIVHECVKCKERYLYKNVIDGVRCSYCKANLTAIGLRAVKEQDKVVIELTNANEPPKVFLNGERIPVNRLRVDYETDTKIRGRHNFDLTYIDEEEKQLKSMGFMKGV